MFGLAICTKKTMQYAFLAHTAPLLSTSRCFSDLKMSETTPSFLYEVFESESEEEEIEKPGPEEKVKSRYSALSFLI